MTEVWKSMNDFLKQNKKAELPKIPIELKQTYNSDGVWMEAKSEANDFTHVILLGANHDSYDEILCITSLGMAIYYLGYWNDGVV